MDFASYGIKDASRFKGREEEIKKFLRIIDSGTMSVLYANSGIGKTSFLNAGISPIYQKMGYFPIHIVFPDEVFSFKDIEPWLLQRIKDAFVKQDSVNTEKDRFIWESTIETDIEDCKNSLWWHLHTKVMKDNRTGDTYYPLLVFDQFEEIFRKSKKYTNNEIIEKFFTLAGHLASTSLPRKIEEELDRQDRKGNYVEIDSEHHYKVVFSLRKEYLSDFDYWTNDVNSISELHQNRMFLLPLKREQAMKVITQQPKDDNSSECYTTLNKVKDKILDLIDPKKKDEIEPFMLSALCSKLYNKAISGNKEQLVSSDVDANINTIVLEIYEEKVQRIFSDSDHLKRFENALVDGDGHRNRPKIKELEDILFAERYQKQLEDAHLIRIDNYDDDIYIELIHDLLAKAINKKREEEEQNSRIAKLEKGKKRQKYIYGGLILTLMALAFAVYKYLTKPITIIEDKYADVMLVFNPNETLEGDPWEADVHISLLKDTTNVILVNKTLAGDSVHIKGPGADTIKIRLQTDIIKNAFSIKVTSHKEWLCEEWGKTEWVKLEMPSDNSLRTLSWATTLTRDERSMYKFDGHVTTQHGTPIVDAFVVLGDKLARTDTTGYFIFTMRDSRELMGRVIHIFKSEYVSKEVRGVDFLRNKYSFALQLKPEYDSLYYRVLTVADKIVNKKDELTTKDSSLINMYFGDKYSFKSSKVQSPDTIFYYVFKIYHKAEADNEEGRIFGYYYLAKDEERKETPFDGYLQEIDPIKNIRRWQMTISAYDSVFNKEPITGIIRKDSIDLSK